MVFSSVEFLFAFLPLTLAAHALAPVRARNAVLLVASLVFFAWGTGGVALLFAAGIVVNHRLGLRVATSRAALLTAIVANVAVLVVVRHGPWLMDLATLDGRIGGGAWNDQSWVVPLGLSFFTFQTLSYHLDVRRGDAPVQRSLIDFGLFVALFPHQVAGPILRYRLIEPALRDREITLEGFSSGSVRFAQGLAKKVLVADTLAPLADAAFAPGPDPLGAAAAWLGVLAYALQLYFDFSGYSDMAIGLGRMLGFPIPENFARPYTSASLREFWRRWHISLGAWFRDYLYLPLGGNRSHPSRNLLLVFLLVGAWHGVGATFLLWGLGHGVAIVVERRLQPDGPRREWAGRARTALVVLLGWVLFRAEDLSGAIDVYRSMLGLGGDLAARSDAMSRAIEPKSLLVLVLASLVFVGPRRPLRAGPLVERAGRVAGASRALLVGVGLPYAALVVAASSFRPFLYFEF